MYITRLLVNEDGAVFGAYGFDQETGLGYVIQADAVILAAGRAQPDLAAHLLPPQREHRGLLPPGRGGRGEDP